jgi:hypothetical protein
MNDFGEFPKPEFREYSLENFGYLLRDSASLTPDVLPYIVSVPKKSNFFRSIYDNVYKGRGTTVKGSASRLRPRGVLVEHEATMAANDLGELMISKDIFEGDPTKSLTKLSQVEYYKHITFLKNAPFPPGWRVFGSIHSHPVFDVANEVGMHLINQIPKVNSIPLTWSGGDFNSFIHEAKYGFNGLTTLGLINQTQLSFMVASKTSVEKFKSSTTGLKDIEVPQQSIPPYKRFSELGIVLYGGIHRNGQEIIRLERLT